MKKAKFVVALMFVMALALALSLTMVACNGDKNNDNNDNGPKFETQVLEDGTISVTGLSSVYEPEDHTLTIPETLEGRTVTQVTISKGYDPSTRSDIISPNISDMVLPDTVRQLGCDEYTFDGIPGIARFNIPRDLRNITSHAFDDIELSTTTVDGMSYLGTEENPYMILWQVQSNSEHLTGNVTQGTRKLTLRDETTIVGPNALLNRYTSSYTSVDIVDLKNATILCDEAFSQYNRTDCPVSSIIGVDKLKYVGDYALHGCNMSAVYFGADLEYLGKGAFTGSSKLETIDISNSAKLKTIGDYCFEGCTKVGSRLDPTLNIPASVEIIGDYAFSSDSFVEIVFGSNSKLKEIGDYAFASNSKLSGSLELPEGLLSIGSNAFYGNYSLGSVTIPASVTYIGRGAFDPNPRTGSLQATFADTNGWGVSKDSGAERNEMTTPALRPATDPNGPAINGNLLQGTYVDYYWRKA